MTELKWHVSMGAQAIYAMESVCHLCVCVGGLAHSAIPLSHPPQAKCPTCYLLDFHLALLCSSDNFNFYRQGKA